MSGINTGIKGATFYKDNKRILDNVEITVPEVEFTTIEVEGLGKIEVPNYASIEQLDLSLKYNGTSEKDVKFVTPGLNTLEFRFVDGFIGENGKTINKGCKLFAKGYPKTIPSLSVVKGEQSEKEVTYSVTRMQLMVAGKEIYLIDKLAGIVKIDGKDYTSAINKML